MRSAAFIALCFLSANTAWSQETEEPPVFTSPQASGQVVDWTPDTGELVLRTPNEELTLKVRDGSTVFVNGRLGERSDIREGQAVRTAYEKSDGELRVRWLEVLPDEAKKPSGTNRQKTP